MAVTLNSVQIADPSNTGITKFRIEKSARTASGRLVTDIVAYKRRVTLDWGAISEPDLKQIMDIMEQNTFAAMTCPDPQSGDSLSLNVTVEGDITATRSLVINGVRHWEGAQIAFVEG